METASVLAAVLREITAATHVAEHLQVSDVSWHPIFMDKEVQWVTVYIAIVKL
jgi:hypothetical protein